MVIWGKLLLHLCLKFLLKYEFRPVRIILTFRRYTPERMNWQGRHECQKKNTENFVMTWQSHISQSPLFGHRLNLQPQTKFIANSSLVPNWATSFTYPEWMLVGWSDVLYCVFCFCSSTGLLSECDASHHCRD